MPKKFRIKNSFANILQDRFDRDTLQDPVLTHIMTQPDAQCIEPGDTMIPRPVRYSKQPSIPGHTAYRLPVRSRVRLDLSVGLVFQRKKLGRVEKHPLLVGGTTATYRLGHVFPCFRPVYHSCSTRRLPIPSWRNSAQSPAAYTSGTFVSKYAFTRIPRRVSIPDACARSMFGCTPAVMPTNWQGISSPSLVVTARTPPVASGRMAFSSVARCKSMPWRQISSLIIMDSSAGSR